MWRVVTAGPISRFVLTMFGFVAVVVPWHRVYVLAEYRHNPLVLAHEAVHVIQIKRDGAWYFWTRCIWWYLVCGYENSPYEIEARVWQYTVWAEDWLIDALPEQA